MVAVDFLELDHMREFIVEYAKKRGLKPKPGKRKPWDKSGFYIGRHTVRFYFNGISFRMFPSFRIELYGMFSDSYDIRYKPYGFELTLKPWLRGGNT